MAFITLNTKKLKQNFEFLDNLFKESQIHWTIVSKILCGNKLFLTELLKLDIKQISDSRVSNLRVIKSIRPDIETVYLRPPSKRSIPNIMKYANVSMNTEIETIKMLSEEAQRQNKIHKVIIMIELGDLREGVMGDDFIDFYEKVFQLKNILVIGIGTNLSCLYGVLPNHDKLIQLCLYKQLIETKFNKVIPFVSGGSSVTIPLMFQNILPKGINHFRVGESLFLGTDVYNDSIIEEMNPDVFRLYSEIIELIEKPIIPMGEIGTNVEGESFDFNEDNLGETTFRAIVDLGLLDVDENHIKPVDENIHSIGASSDMLVIDLGENKKNYKVGDLIEFKMDYMGALRVLNSKYIGKELKQE